MVEAIRQGDIPGVQLRCRRRLGVSAAVAWDWLREPEKLCLWLAEEVELVPGGRDEPQGKERLVVRCNPSGATVGRGRPQSVVEVAETLEIEAPRRWVLSFRREEAGWDAATRLTLEVSDLPPEGCELGVFHQGFERLALSQCLTIWEGYRKRWRQALERLRRATAGHASS